MISEHGNKIETIMQGCIITQSHLSPKTQDSCELLFLFFFIKCLGQQNSTNYESNRKLSRLINIKI